MAEKKLTNVNDKNGKAAAQEAEKKTDDAYVIPDEVCCSPVFPQGCISGK